ncbi:hypothetical protein Tco_0451551 [Tanacetum coccineum]
MPSLPPPKPTVSYFDDFDFFKDFKNEFLAILYNDALTSKSDFSTEPVVIPQHVDEFDLKDEASLSEYNEEEQNVLYFNDLFSFNIISPDDSKSNEDNDDDKSNIEHSSGDLSVKPLPDVINTDVGAYAHSTVYTMYSSNEYSVYRYQYDESWGMDTTYRLRPRERKSTNIGGESKYLEILKCWSLETSRRLFNTQSCSINATWRIYRENIKGVSHSNSF